MATVLSGRTSSEIYTSIIDEIQNSTALIALAPQIDSEQDLLDDLDKDSKVASWRLYAWTIAYITSIFESNLDNFYDVTLDVANDNIIGTAKWLAEQAKNYQDGDTIAFNELTNRLEYEVEDTTKQIVTASAVEEVGNKIILKVRKTDSTLSASEQERFNIYISTIKMIGTTIEVRSVAWDEMILNIDVYYNGQRDKSEVQTEVEAAINNYIDNIEFNDTIRATTITDGIQEVEGVIDVHFKQSSGNPIIGGTTNFTYTYNTYAGSAQISDASPLSTTISYIPKKEY